MEQRPTCYFDITADDSPVGRIEFELLNDVAPITAENFRVLCTGEKKGFTYKYCNIHFVQKDSYMQGGDFMNNNGTGNVSIYDGGIFNDENFYMKPSRPGILCMANKGPNTNGSQFMITLEPKPFWNLRHVAFGRVKNMDVVRIIEEKYGSTTGTPTADIRISDCGQL